MQWIEPSLVLTKIVHWKKGVHWNVTYLANTRGPVYIYYSYSYLSSDIVNDNITTYTILYYINIFTIIPYEIVSS